MIISRGEPGTARNESFHKKMVYLERFERQAEDTNLNDTLENL